MPEIAHVKENWWCQHPNMKSMVEWPTFLGFFLAQGVKMHFPKTDGFSNSNLGFLTLPIPCNNQPNQFLAVINDWVNKTRTVVDSLVGSPFDIWIFPIGPKVKYPPPYP